MTRRCSLPLQRFSVLAQGVNTGYCGVFSQQEELLAAGQLPADKYAGIIPLATGAAAHGILKLEEMQEVIHPQSRGSHL
ncbi:MAG: hypothetical protein WAN35_14845 [Terracidiphilus sp.]